MHILYLATDTTNYLSLSFDFSKYVILVIQSLSRVQLFATPWTVAHQAPLSYIISRSLFKFMFIELMMLSSHLMLCHLILLLPSIFLSIRPSNEYSGLISLRMDWLDLLAVQGTLKSLLQHHSSKASTLQRSAFFMVQLSHSHMTTGKTIALTRCNSVGKVMFLLFNTLPRFAIAFLPRSKRLLISWLQSPSAVILVPKKIKSVILF